MCGIFGLINGVLSKDPLSFLAHRGPDDSGSFQNEWLFLGHTRLSILDVSQAGHQPMFYNDDDLVIVFNGEIYNHLDLRKELEVDGYQFASTSDTETILAAWKKWGTESVKLLNGIFAFAIYQKSTNQLYVVRDRFGVKPLYIYQKENQLAFSSEIKSFFSIDSFDTTLEPTNFHYYNNFLYAPGSPTPYKYVYKLLPATVLKIDVESALITEQLQFHSFKKEVTYSKSSLEEIVDELDTRMRTAISRQLLSDVPVGYFLSGGLDSSLIVAMAKSMHPTKNLDCFTIDAGIKKSKEGFTEDLPYAKMVADYLGVNLHIVNPQFNWVRDFDQMIWHLDEPQADLAPINLKEICGLAAEKGIKVLLSGAGGDDLFSGYRRHQALGLEKALNLIPKPLLKIGRSLALKIPSTNPKGRRVHKLTRDWTESKEDRFLNYFLWTSKSDASGNLFSQALKPTVKAIDPFNYHRSLLVNMGNRTLLDKMLLLERYTFLCDHNLNYSDKLSMAVGVEVRVPFLDNELVEFSESIPSLFKLKGTTTKFVLKKVAEKYLPKEVIYRPKTGFGSPIRQLIENDFQDMIQQRLNEKRLTEQGIFNPQEVQILLRDYLSGKREDGYIILSLLAIQSWLDQFKHKQSYETNHTVL
ncbi:asparagine synthase (glutamine-hydrolyzing) [Mongoliitalea lutea]|uniref:asparagine synthase (glutamine-hydrolyzing) n=1 Tax=Mongoliitalea lutea TaxID=849756 RepID=A0A8J3CVT5_9BACT|nr:asparagine synthase (glutamine-hydrolyzing) [Mongoliitalea lutea]GHB31357.1 asparagine synthetase B [Mongoliitalea lutea]